MTNPIYVVANWKMHKTARESIDYIEKLLPKVEGSQVNIYLAVPFTTIATAAQYAKGTPLVIGAQNMNDARDGAFTGEIAALMLKEAGAEFVLIGHSERRHIFHETDAFIHRKLVRALQDDIRPILCVGETEKERDAGKMEDVLKKQCEIALEGIPKESSEKLILAYEPVWAIGTGKTASIEEIQEAHAFCKKCLGKHFGKNKVPILYGGSVKSSNVAEIIAQDDVDGVLVGGASLDPQGFADIVSVLSKKKSKS